MEELSPAFQLRLTMKRVSSNLLLTLFLWSSSDFSFSNRHPPNPEEFELIFEKVHAQWHVVSPFSSLCLLSLWQLGAFVWLHFYSFMNAIKQKFHLKRAGWSRKTNDERIIISMEADEKPFPLCSAQLFPIFRRKAGKHWKDIISIFFKFACRKAFSDEGTFCNPCTTWMDLPPHTSLSIFVTNSKAGWGSFLLWFPI